MSDHDTFVRARPRLLGIAYRVLGSRVDADDVVQEAWVRWERTQRAAIRNPDAWLTTVVTRLALDRLRARKRDEERYVGPWLPEPLVERVVDPEATAELADSMTTAFLLMLERLSPDERAAFLLAEVFDEPYRTIADVLGRTEESCRQLASRARRKLHDERGRRYDEADVARRVVERFLAAVVSGDEDAALACLAVDAVLLSDGGSARRAARRPVVGPSRIVRLVTNLYGRRLDRDSFAAAVVGGFPGLVWERGGRVEFMVSFEVVGGAIVRVLTMLNPDKLSAAGFGGGEIV
jgi:RNA polymerase sigma-70 factor (ECF subfamily)